MRREDQIVEARKLQRQLEREHDRWAGVVAKILEGSIADAESRLAPLPWILGVGGALVWLLAYLGLRPRLNEYRA